MRLERGFVILCILAMTGCCAYTMKQQLRKQLSQDNKYKVIIQSFDSVHRTAYVRIIDKSKFIDLQGAKTFHHYRYDGKQWIEYDPNRE